ncbi:MAG: sel1 repeat family protein [Proteobacteria bacterium]|nr:sel1 repeat family protein [Pseudomonadota bacterium]
MKRVTAFAVLLVVLAAPACTVYDEGLAAAKRGDYATALREWRPLAEQGYAMAQFNLGVMYAKGHGVTTDYVQAHMWFNLAAAQGDKKAVKGLNIIARGMIPAQIAEAQRLAREWMAAHQKK